MATTDGGAVKTLQAHLEEMRSLTLCNICLRPLFEPFIIGCGHTFCYGCLRNWFGGSNDRKKHKSCPECRKDVKVEPAPNYLLRELTHRFIDRVELLPEDENVADHLREKAEEADQLSKDRKGVGLFQGLFKRPQYQALVPGPIHDYEDGVERCPVCAWEVEDGRCSGCGLPVGDSEMSDDDDIDLSDLSGMDDDDSSSDSDSEDEPVGGTPDPRGIAQFLSNPPADHLYQASDDPDLDAYDQHDDFVDDDEEIDVDGMDDVGDYDDYSTAAGTTHSAPRSQADGGALSSADLFTGLLSDFGQPRRTRRVVNDSDDLDSADERPPPSYGRNAVVLSDEEEDDDDIVIPRRADPVSTSLGPPVFMMPDLSDNETESSGSSDEGNNEDVEHESDPGTEDSSSDSDSGSGSEPNSDSESENDTIQGEGAADGNASEESDDTVIPPQPKRIRQERLQEHRDSRGRRINSGSAHVVHGASANPQGRLRMAPNAGHSRHSRRARLTSVH